LVSVPELSVVVPSVNGLDDLLDCLAALDAQRDEVHLEVIVVDRLGEHVRHETRRVAPWVRVIAAAPDTPIPELRATAFREAHGGAVAVIEDHVIVPPGWGRLLLDALGAGEHVVGGSVENAATDTLLDWAAFLCEYSHCLPPLPEGPSDWLTGNNVVYRRELLERYRSVTDAGRWENHLHDRLRADGIQLVCRPEIRVGHKKHYTFGEYLSQRFLYARSYAAARVDGASAAKRLLYGAAAFGLPPLLFARTLSRVLAKGRHRALLLRSLPLIAIFVCSWGLGEVVGYWFGAGNSAGRVR
jgi:glycosyltransferase involved in cell wall biosynthesis